MAASLRVALAFLALVLTLPLRQASAEPQSGWWWNPNESGRGFFIEMTDGVIYLAGYFYDTDGRATWLSSGGQVTDPYSFSGTLQSYRDGQSVFGAYRPPAPAVDVGPVTVTFSGDSHGTLTWPGGTVPIERQRFGEFGELVLFEPFIPLDPVFRPKTGWWWNSDESGSGYSVEIQGDQMFVVAFMYNDSGEPIWYFSAGPMSSPSHFEGDWLLFSGGQTLTGSYRPPTSRALGRVTVDFDANDSATIVFDETATSPNATSARKSITAGSRSRTSKAAPQFPQKYWRNESDYPPYFACKIVHEYNTIAEAGTVGGLFRTNSVTTYDLLFKLDTSLALTRFYKLEPSSSFNYSYDDNDTSNGCHTYASVNGVSRIKGWLYISPDLNYDIYVADGDPLGILVTLSTDSCVNVQSQPPDTTRHVSNRVDLDRFSRYWDNKVQAVRAPSGALAAYTLNGFAFPYDLQPKDTDSSLKWNCSSQQAPPPIRRLSRN